MRVKILKVSSGAAGSAQGAPGSVRVRPGAHICGFICIWKSLILVLSTHDVQFGNQPPGFPSRILITTPSLETDHFKDFAKFH